MAKKRGMLIPIGLRISNYGVFKESVSIPFTDEYGSLDIAMFGANGSGKTTVIEAFRLLLSFFCGETDGIRKMGVANWRAQNEDTELSFWFKTNEDGETMRIGYEFNEYGVSFEAFDVAEDDGAEFFYKEIPQNLEAKDQRWRWSEVATSEHFAEVKAGIEALLGGFIQSQGEDLQTLANRLEAYHKSDPDVLNAAAALFDLGDAVCIIDGQPTFERKLGGGEVQSTFR